MNGYRKACSVEERGRLVLLPFLHEQADGRLVMLDRGPLARALQRDTGDGLFQMPNGRVWSVEIKVESGHTGNLFLESWSNRNLEDRDRRAEYGLNPGWLLKLRSDLLLYYFLDSDQLYTFDLMKLQRWSFNGWRVAREKECPQRKYSQANDTRGWLVPLSVLAREVGYRLTHPRQMPLFPGDESPWEAA